MANDVTATDTSVVDILQQMQQQGCALTCSQMEQLITTLQAQKQTVVTVAATVAAGNGPIPQPQATWAPWPAHSWPNANTPSAQAVEQAANQIVSTDDEVNNLWTQMQAQGC